jgi:hypothetical protein
MTNFDSRLAGLYGPAAAYSEYLRGDYVRYMVGAAVHTGVIVWITASGQPPLQGWPLRYIISRQDGPPDVVAQTDIFCTFGPQEPVLIRCPHCLAWHLERHVQMCPLNPDKPTS